MRIFWSLIALLVLGTAAALFLRRSPAPIVPPTPPPVVLPDVRPVPTPTPPVRAADPAPPSDTAQVTPKVPDPQPQVPDPRPAEAVTQPVTPPIATTPAPIEDPNPQPAVELPALPDSTTPSTDYAKAGFVGPPPNGVDELAAPPTPAALASSSSGSPPAGNGASAPDLKAAAQAAAAAASGPAKLEPQADGTVLVDGRFVMRGDGTKAKPYEVTWEHLMSVQETYKPRMGLKVIPDRVNMLHNKWVTISGYVAFPVMAEGLDEMLMMLNQWDGCCIGVPPTPFDAIEVKLNTPAEGETRLLIMGTVTGKLQVDPYLVKDWLVSLYLMDETTVGKQTGVPLRDSAMQQEHMAP